MLIDYATRQLKYLLIMLQPAFGRIVNAILGFSVGFSESKFSLMKPNLGCSANMTARCSANMTAINLNQALFN